MADYSDTYWKDRGPPWEHDEGPAKNLSWSRLFSETPNYRQLSETALGSEKFRWHFGPMYYRGRLKPGSVKVVIIGQEGAQDECLSHRSFTGGTGARMQAFLNFIGIDRSYLFVNTFVYPIFGQYGSSIRWLAQDPRSPIVKQRHDIFNYILKKNDVHLVVAVGTAAKETVVTWVESRGGTCPDGASDLSTSTGLAPNVRAVGVLHPGGAAQSGALAAIKRSFQKAVDDIKGWNDSDASWLPCDPGVTRDLSTPYPYGRAPIPFRDLPFGVCWRLGRGGTSSNRKDSQRSIQLFSAAGKYNNKGHSISYSDQAHGSNDGYSGDLDDVPYEPPVDQHKAYDKGPGSAFAKLFAGAASGLQWPDFQALGVNAHSSLGFGPIYRGRPYSARVLVLADQQSQDDLFTCRALSGEAGQRLQAYLAAIGITRSYCILRVLPVDMLDLGYYDRRSVATDPQVVSIYEAIFGKILGRKRTKVILALGSVSRELMDRLDTGNVNVIELKAWSQSGAKKSWQDALPTLQGLSYKQDISSPTFAYSGEKLQIPRFDLPYGTLRWQGSCGDRSRRALLPSGDPSPDYYKLFMPDWVFQLDPPPLSGSETQAISNHP